MTLGAGAVTTFEEALFLSLFLLFEFLFLFEEFDCRVVTLVRLGIDVELVFTRGITLGAGAATTFEEALFLSLFPLFEFLFLFEELDCRLVTLVRLGIDVELEFTRGMTRCVDTAELER